MDDQLSIRVLLMPASAIKRFTIADEKGLQHDIENQRNWNDLVMQVQDIQ